MKFTINKNVMAKPIDQVSKALSSKENVPILTQILFELTNDGLTITAGDTATYIRAQIGADDLTIERTGRVALPGRKVTDIVKKMGDEITFEVNGLNATIKSGKSKFELTGMEAEEYPTFPAVTGESMVISGEKLRSMVSKTIYAVSTNEATPILTGILFNISEDRIQLTACDRHRLARVSSYIKDGIDFTIVISGKNLSELMKLVKDSDEVELYFTENQFIAKTQDITFFSRVLEGTYPDTTRLIPFDFKSVVKVDTFGLREAFERVEIIAADEKTNLIKLKVGEEIEIVSSAQNGKVYESLDAIEFSGDLLTVSFNAKFALQALNTIDTDKAVVSFAGPMSPIIFREADNDELIGLVLPYRTSEG